MRRSIRSGRYWRIKLIENAIASVLTPAMAAAATVIVRIFFIPDLQFSFGGEAESRSKLCAAVRLLIPNSACVEPFPVPSSLIGRVPARGRPEQGPLRDVEKWKKNKTEV